jgi:rhodanese-related sulfurtransferase
MTEPISKEELEKKLSTGEPLQLINVLGPEHALLGLIRGSRRIPLAELNKRSGELDKARDVIVYCASQTCSASKQAAQLLSGLGFNARAYEGGIAEWKNAGLPMEPEAQAA